MRNLKKTVLLSFMFSLLYCSSNDSDTYDNTSGNYIDNSCPPNSGTCCGVSGNIKVRSLKKYTYFVSTTLKNPYITWEIKSGSIKTISLYGNKATFIFRPNFTSGRIQANVLSLSGGGSCQTIIDISKL
jgi:hypothetical protein